MARAILTLGVLLVASLTLAPAASAGPLNCDPSLWDPEPPSGWERTCNAVNKVHDAPQDFLDCVGNGHWTTFPARVLACV